MAQDSPSPVESHHEKRDRLCWWFSGESYFSTRDIMLLRSSFGIMRDRLSSVGTKGFTKLFDQYPSAFKVFIGKKVLPEKRSEVYYSWETKQHSLRVFHTIEKCLNRINKPDSFRKFVKGVAARHVEYGAHPNHALSLISCLRTCFLDDLKLRWPNREQDGWPEELDDPRSLEDTISAWNKFFASLSIGMVSTMSALPHEQSSSDSEAEASTSRDKPMVLPDDESSTSVG